MDEHQEIKENIVTRIAPSPTGVLHIGTARTALFNYLFAKQNNGKFILRIEDTDKIRSTKEYEEDIVNGLNKLGLESDEFYRQSERTDIYKKYIEKLIQEDKAYISKEEGGERSEVVRLRNQNKKVTFEDMIRGEITFDTTDLGDFVIAKSLEEPLYHLAVVVDDFEMKITHVIRGEDGISNTPRQILIQEAIGANTPTYAHLPLILGKDKSKLSKRHGATSINEFWNKGYLTEAIINQLAFLGWNPGTDQELFNLDSLINDFNIKKVQKGGAVFDEEKLRWFNGEYLKNISDDVYLDQVKEILKDYNISDNDYLLKLKTIFLERISTFNDLKLMLKNGELDYYFKDPAHYNQDDLIWKNSSKVNTLTHLEKVKNIISDIDFKENITTDEIKMSIWPYAEEQGKGDVLWPLRFSLSGVQKSPDPITLIYVLGKEVTLKRINTAIKILKNN